MEEIASGGVLFRVTAPGSDEGSLRLLASALSRKLAQRSIPAVAELMSSSRPPMVEVRSFDTILFPPPNGTVVLSKDWNPELEAERLVGQQFPSSSRDSRSGRASTPPPTWCTAP